MLPDAHIGFRPEVSRDDLAVFVERIRPVMPHAVWAVVQPWSHMPRLLMPDTYGLAEAEPDRAGMVCEINAPIRWHDLVDGLADAYLRHPAPTPAQLGAAWERLEAEGLRPAVCVNLGPWQPQWSRAGVNAAPGAWAIEVVGLSAIGPVTHRCAHEVAALVGGQLGVLTRNPDWAWWSTC